MNCPTRAEILEVIHGLTAGDRELHIRECSACRKIYAELMAATEALARFRPGPASGPCLSDEQLIRYATQDIHPDLATKLEEHLAACPKCLGDVVTIVEASEAEPAEVPADLRDRVLGKTAAPAPRLVTRRITARRRPTKSSPYPWILAAAAVLLVAIIFIAIRRDDTPVKPEPQRPTVTSEPKKETPKEEKVVERPKREEPRREEPKDEKIVEIPKRDEPRREEPKKDPEPKKEPEKKDEVVKQEDPPKDTTKVEEKKYRNAVVSDVRGELFLRQGGASRRIQGGEIALGDDLHTGARWKASFLLNADARLYLRENSSLRVEQLETGEISIRLQEGEAFFEVEKRASTFLVAAPHANAIVVGTAFCVKVRKQDTTLLVSEGTVRFQNSRGEVLVEKDQKSVATATAKPSAPVRTDVAAEVTWTTRGDIAKEPPKDPYIEHIGGTNPKFPGLVIVSPYSEREVDSGKLARPTSDLLECGLVLGHHHRDKGERKIWLNIDRGTEGKVADDGSVGTAESTKRAQEVYAEYLKHVRAAAGVSRQVPMIVHFREHSETIPGGGEELAVCEVAWSGFDRKTLKQLKALYEELVKEHKPSYVVTLKFDELDDQYEFAGQKIKFKYTEGDAKTNGYMGTQNSRRSIAFFFNPSFGNRADDFAAYSKIFAKMIEFLYRS